jgi:hypothetical protein
LKPLSWKSLKSSAAGALTSGRRPSGAAVVESFLPTNVFTWGPPGHVTMAWLPENTVKY